MNYELTIKIISLTIFSYLAGSINFAVLLFRIIGKEDPRNKFSGNAGTTNVYRQSGIFWAALVFILDTGRAIVVSALSIYLLKPEYIPLIGLTLIAGNRFPCFHRFHGGKGVANYLGFTLLLAPLWTAGSAIAWLIVYFFSRLPFIASFAMIIVLAAGTLYNTGFSPIPAAVASVTALFIIYNHKNNIKKMINHEK